MRKLLALFLIPILPAMLVAQTNPAARSQSLVFTHVTVIDMTGVPARPDMTVVIGDGRISALGKFGRIRIPKGSKVINAAGRFLIPGLWDMHIHSGGYQDGRKNFPVFVANGITGVRDMASPPEDVLRLRKEADAGNFASPRMIVAGPILQGPLHFQMPLLRSVSNESEVKETVSYLKKSGVDFIKIGDSLPRDLYFVLAAETKRQGVPFAGHLPIGVGAGEASDSGQRSIEHFGSARFHGVLLACSTREAELGKYVGELLEAAKKGDESADTKLFRAGLTKPLLDTFSDEKATSLFALFAKNQTWQVPTLVALREVWTSKRKELGDEDKRYGDRVWQKYLEMVSAMRRKGVMLLAGTDLPLNNGVSRLHEELSLLVQAGLTPMEALQTATRNPAKFMGRSDMIGTVEKGKIADLVLLDASPLENIGNTQKI
ncbi:MAG TPA: amidohydrolase family protein, partial [Pyrinomonadaceae bacterium]